MEFTGKEFKAIGSFASTDLGRPSLNGIWIDKSRIFATDGHILIVQKLEDLDRTLFVPVGKLKGIKAKDKIEIRIDGVYLVSELGQIKISDNDHARNTSASPPDIDRVIPDFYDEITPMGSPITCLSCHLVSTCMKALEKLGAKGARWQLGETNEAIRIDATKLDRETTIVIMPMRL